MQPGDTLHPRGEAPESPSQKPNEVSPNSPAPDSSSTESDSSTWYHPEVLDTSSSPAAAQSQDFQETSQPESEEISWRASEFIAHDKPLLWYVIFVFLAAVLGGVIFLLVKEVLMVVLVVLALGAFGVMASRRPRVLEYRLSDSSIDIGADQHYSYGYFKSYSVFNVDAMQTIELKPLQRFRPPVTLYYPPERQQQIFAKLSDKLPFEDRDPDMVEWLMHRLRF